MKCEITGCEKKMEPFHPSKPRTDGVIIEVLNTHRAYMVCTECAKKLGLIK